MLLRVRQYFGNPWDRVAQEMSAATGGLANLADGNGGEADGEPLDEDEAKKFAGLLLSEEHTKPELQAFLYAWSGSIKFQREEGLAAMADAAMSLEVFLKVFVASQRAAVFPKIVVVPPRIQSSSCGKPPRLPITKDTRCGTKQRRKKR